MFLQRLAPVRPWSGPVLGPVRPCCGPAVVPVGDGPCLAPAVVVLAHLSDGRFDETDLGLGEPPSRFPKIIWVSLKMANWSWVSAGGRLQIKLSCLETDSFKSLQWVKIMQNYFSYCETSVFAKNSCRFWTFFFYFKVFPPLLVCSRSR